MYRDAFRLSNIQIHIHAYACMHLCRMPTGYSTISDLSVGSHFSEVWATSTCEIAANEASRPDLQKMQPDSVCATLFRGPFFGPVRILLIWVWDFRVMGL